jgi:hypothetical protein
MDRVRGFRTAFEADAHDWGVHAGVAWGLVIAPFVVLAAFLATYPARSLFRLLMGEDGIVEWTQFVCLVIALPIAAGLTWTLARRRHLLLAGLFALVTLGVFFVAMEEISWGQRILDFATPTGLVDINDQGEANIHNIPLIEHAFGFAELAVSIYAIVASIAVALTRPAVPRLYLLVPPVFTAGAFAIAAGYRLARLTVASDGTFVINRIGEAAELFLYAAILVFLALALRRLRADVPEAAGAPEATGSREATGAPEATEEPEGASSTAG